MGKIDFTLQPFWVDPHNTGLSIEGTVHRDGGTLRLEYRLQGRLDTLAIPPMAPQPERRRELWKETCFEAFIQPAGSTGYWELNLSPAGHWNLYRFDGYRQGMREASPVTELSVDVQKIEGALALSTRVDLATFSTGDFKLGVSAVIRFQNGHLDYWALTHPDTKPDFHHPKSFDLAL